MKKLRRTLSLSMAVVIFTTVFMQSATIVHAETRSFIWVESSLVKVFESTQVPDKPKNTIEIVSAKNEYRSGQIVITAGETDLTNVSVSVSALTSGGATIAKENIKATFIDYIKLTAHTMGLSAAETIIAPDGSMNYPDKITNDTTKAKISKKTSRPIWYSVYVPKETPKGVYTGTVTVTTNEGTSSIPVSVNIYDVTVQDSKDSDYRFVYWLADWWDNFDTQATFGVDMYSEEWWGVMKNYAKYMKKIRNNTIQVDLDDTIQKSVDANGKIVFDYTRFDRFIQTFIDEGALGYIHGASYLPWTAVNSDTKAETFMIPSYSVVDGQIKLNYLNPQDKNNEEWFIYFFTDLKKHLEQKGWLDIYYQGGGSEPLNDRDYEAVNWFYTTMDKHFGNAFKTYDPNHVFKPTPNIDEYVIQMNIYDANQGFYKNEQAKGKELMLYLCNLISNKYMNRSIDAHLSKTLLPQWYAFKNNMVGFLHWGFNVWGKTDPTAIADSPWPGDNWVVYPGKENKSLFSSIRSEITLEGVQDNELFTMLAKSGKEELAMNIVESIVTNGQEYVTDPDAIVKARTAVLENLSKSATAVTVVDDCKNLNGLLSYGENIVSDDKGISINAAPIASFTDDFTDLTKLHSYTANVKDDKTVIAGISDKSRLVKTASSSQNIVYKLPKIVDFSVKAYYQEDETLAFYTSSDGTNWKKLIIEKQNVSKNSDWNAADFVAESVPAASNYLKIEILQSNDKFYNTQIGRTEIRYCETTVNDLNKNTIIYNEFNIREVTASLSYNSPYVLEFYSSQNAKEWNKLEVLPTVVNSGSSTTKNVKLTCSDIPQNSNYIKIIFTNDNIGENIVHLTRMDIVCGYGEYKSKYPQWSNKSGFAATDIFADAVGLQWDFAISNVSQIANYVLYQDGTVLATYGNDIFSTRIDNLKPNTPYMFELVAVDEAGESSVVEQVKAATLSDIAVNNSISIKKISVTDSDGKPTDSLASGAEITANAVINNSTQSPKDIVVVAVISNAKGQMQVMNHAKIALIGGAQDQTCSVTVRVPQNINRCKMEIFIWDSLEAMNPLSYSTVFFD